MYPSINLKNTLRQGALTVAVLLVVAMLLAFAVVPILAQTTTGQESTSKPQQSPNAQPAPPAAGGPQGDIGPMAIPKKTEQPPEPKPTGPKKVEGMPDFSIRKDVPLVNVPVMVLTKNGQFVPGLKKDNFKILEDGVPQKIATFTQTEDAPITAVLLVEFAANNYSFMYDALNASYTFAETLKPQDWIAVVSFDMKPHLLTDFTQDKRAVYGALGTLRIPGFRETNVFDALYDTLDRLDGVEGHKYVVLIATGRDTFSKLTYDQILKKVQATKNVTIFTISTGEALRMWVDARAGGNPEVSMAMMDYLQADNEMNTFAKMTGGRWYKPRLEGELPEIFHDIAASIRNQYSISYYPSNSKQDGTYRKLKVELQASDGGPLTFKDQKGKDLKIQVVARDGYRAKHEVE